MPDKIEIKVAGGEIVMGGATLKHLDAIKAIPGRRWHPQTKTWRWRATPATATRIRDGLERQWFDDQGFLDLLNQEQAGRNVLGFPMATSENFSQQIISATIPWDHQVRAYHLVRLRKCAMLALDMGTGKSKVIVDIVNNLQLRRTLIVCPKSVVQVWEDEYNKHTLYKCAEAPEAIMLLLGEGTTAKRANMLNRTFELYNKITDPVPIVAVVNYEAIISKALKPILLAAGWDMVVADESHRIKAAGGVISRTLDRIGKRAEYRVCLTGTPMPHSPLDIHPQYRFMDAGIFGESNYAFKAEYSVPDFFGGVARLKNLDDLHKRFYSAAIRITKDECLDLPPFTHETRYVELPAEARRVYDELDAKFTVEVRDGEITAANALVKLLRLQELTSGYAKLDDAAGTEILHTAKQDALAHKVGLQGVEGLLCDLPADEPVVVFCLFHRDLDAVHEATKLAGRGSVELSGRRNQLKRWQAGEEGCTVLGAQIRSGTLGVNMTRARYAILFSTGFDGGAYQQALARLHRAGQMRNVTYIHLVCRNTVDVRVARALQDKEKIVESVLRSYR